MAKAIMIQGTASGVGKSILTLALCRIFKQDGHRVAPFKAQNMTSNTALITNGGEIAVSQMLQAYAAGIEPDANMNPVLLKPVADGTHVICNCCPHGNMNAYESPAAQKDLLPLIMNAYASLSERYDIIVIEGAGSPVELNLNKNDLVNMGIAKRVNAPVVLVSDIDRGGVFASLYGTLKLFDESDRQYIKSTIINRFKGDISSFRDGVKIIEKITGLPVMGVIPYIRFDLPEEDDLYDTGSPLYSHAGDLNSQFDLIADQIRKSLNLELIYKIVDAGV